MTVVTNGMADLKTHKKRRREETGEESLDDNVTTSSKPSKEERREAKRLKKLERAENQIEEKAVIGISAIGNGEATPNTSNAIQSKTKEEKREAKQSRKLKETNGNGAEAAQTGDNNGAGGNVGMTGDVAVNTTSKEERREAKRSKKLKKLADGHYHYGVEEGLQLKQESEDKSAAKAARKARKAQLKTAEPKQDKELEVQAQWDPSSTAKRVDGDMKNKPNKTAPDPSPKSGYQEEPSLTALPSSEIDSFLSTKFITINDPSSTNPLRPITKFSYFPKSARLSGAPFAGFKDPTPIQSASWPFLLSGRDVIGVAETGSGKTLAFGVPCIRSITTSLPIPKGSAPARAVIVSPTRELAVQIHSQMEALAAPASLYTVCVYGGVPKDHQRAALKTADIIVATPGRLNDLIDEGTANLSNVNYCVLDEADRMLDKGFEAEIRKIISTTSSQGRQTLMFTATWPPSVRELAATFMTQPVHISIGEDNPTGELRANTKIKQLVEVVDPRGKEQRLLQLLKQHQGPAKKNDRILVFCLYKKEAARVEGFLRQRGLKVAGIHGDMGQAARQASLDSFKSGTCPLLVATDVAARGLDIPAVKVVVNVTFPLTVEDYVHRIGRTGRAGAEGLAITLFTEHDKAQSGALINVLRAANQEIPEDLMKFGTTVKKKGHEAYGAFYKDTGAEGKKSTKITFDD